MIVARHSTIVLCESAIDAISYLALNPHQFAVSTSGATPNPPWLSSLIHKQYTVFCGFDSDPAGDRLAEQMIRYHPTIKRLRPSQKDWNDVLVSVQSSAGKDQLI